MSLFPLKHLSETFLVIKKIRRDIVINVRSRHIKCPPFLTDFNQILIFSVDSRKNTQILNFKKILPVGVELFHAERCTNGQTVMTKLLVAFLNFKKKA